MASVLVRERSAVQDGDGGWISFGRVLKSSYSRCGRSQSGPKVHVRVLSGTKLLHWFSSLSACGGRVGSKTGTCRAVHSKGMHRSSTRSRGRDNACMLGPRAHGWCALARGRYQWPPAVRAPTDGTHCRQPSGGPRGAARKSKKTSRHPRNVVSILP